MSLREKLYATFAAASKSEFRTQILKVNAAYKAIYLTRGSSEAISHAAIRTAKKL